ncbi:RNA-binding domain-containing protein [Bradyrhizobium sacchari]|uniref:Putative DNA-binding protein n=1 Tax=Bradyrhizobium sacchari TaxID=1399419 RepID=A0A560I0Z3_9BRAD|nr:RNA-binding domain-containing protein [Bradyrhizobium sacchari]TWB50894.1 putative DNA-binding protein [Bradyrhizobium sacchari]TWB68898.1 putative DNA-binding protein [Bradyrhizobium sacchari]
MTEEVFDSSFQRRAVIAELVENGITDGTVLSYLIVNGHAISDEAVLWDFKIEVPISPPGVKLNEATKRTYDAKFAEIVKDCVSLYNTYGGYLIAGIDNGTRKVVGFSGAFDAADINKRIQAATQVSVETIYRVATFSDDTTPPTQVAQETCWRQTSSVQERCARTRQRPALIQTQRFLSSRKGQLSNGQKPGGFRVSI